MPFHRGILAGIFFRRGLLDRVSPLQKVRVKESYLTGPTNSLKIPYSLTLLLVKVIFTYDFYEIWIWFKRCFIGLHIFFMILLLRRAKYGNRLSTWPFFLHIGIFIFLYIFILLSALVECWSLQFFGWPHMHLPLLSTNSVLTKVFQYTRSRLWYFSRN